MKNEDLQGNIVSKICTLIPAWIITYTGAVKFAFRSSVIDDNCLYWCRLESSLSLYSQTLSTLLVSKICAHFDYWSWFLCFGWVCFFLSKSYFFLCCFFFCLTIKVMILMMLALIQSLQRSFLYLFIKVQLNLFSLATTWACSKAPNICGIEVT